MNVSLTKQFSNIQRTFLKREAYLSRNPVCIIGKAELLWLTPEQSQQKSVPGTPPACSPPPSFTYTHAHTIHSQHTRTHVYTHVLTHTHNTHANTRTHVHTQHLHSTYTCAHTHAHGHPGLQYQRSKDSSLYTKKKRIEIWGGYLATEALESVQRQRQPIQAPSRRVVLAKIISRLAIRLARPLLLWKYIQ